MSSRKNKRKIQPKKRSDIVDHQTDQNNSLSSTHTSDYMPDLTQPRGSSSNNAPLNVFERLNKYSNLIVGIATVLLVIVTGVYIFLSWKIATETKRLADISIEQFKIRSYPAFLVLRTDSTYTDGKYKDEIKIYNKGEISSHKNIVSNILCNFKHRKQTSRKYYHFYQIGHMFIEIKTLKTYRS